MPNEAGTLGTEAAPQTAGVAQVESTSTGTGTAPETVDYKAKASEYETKIKDYEREVGVLNQVRSWINKDEKLKEHMRAVAEGRAWGPPPVEAPKVPEVPKQMELPKEVTEKLGQFDNLNSTVQQLMQAQATQVETAKLDREISDTHKAYPILNDTKMAQTLSDRFNQRVMQVARELRQSDRFTPDESIISEAQARVAQVPYKSLVWDLMEPELAKYVSQQALKGAGRMNTSGRGDRAISQPAGESPDKQNQLEAEMKAASAGRAPDHGKRAEALIRYGIKPQDLGWPD